MKQCHDDVPAPGKNFANQVCHDGIQPGCHSFELTFCQIFDTGNLNILAGPKGLQAGEELTVCKPGSGR